MYNSRVVGGCEAPTAHVDIKNVIALKLERISATVIYL